MHTHTQQQQHQQKYERVEGIQKQHHSSHLTFSAPAAPSSWTDFTLSTSVYYLSVFSTCRASFVNRHIPCSSSSSVKSFSRKHTPWRGRKCCRSSLAAAKVTGDLRASRRLCRGGARVLPPLTRPKRYVVPWRLVSSRRGLSFATVSSMLMFFLGVFAGFPSLLPPLPPGSLTSLSPSTIAMTSSGGS